MHELTNMDEYSLRFAHFSIPKIRSRRRSQNFLECFCHYEPYSDGFIKMYIRNYEYLRIFVFASAIFCNLKSSSHSLRQISKIKIFASHSLRAIISTFAHLQVLGLSELCSGSEYPSYFRASKR